MLFYGEDSVAETVPITLIPISTPHYECTGDISRNSCVIDYHEVAIFINRNKCVVSLSMVALDQILLVNCHHCLSLQSFSMRREMPLLGSGWSCQC
jgi:hypothetical protein